MSVKYALYESPTPKSKGGKPTLHARIIPGNTIRIDRIIKEVTAFSSFSSSDIKGILQAFIDQLVSHLENGDDLELEGLGHFSATLSCPSETNVKKIRTEDIHFKTVKFRCSKQIKKRLNTMRFEKVSRDLKGSPYSPDQRKENIITYLQEHHTIQTSSCITINKCTRYLAKKDLIGMVRDGTIINLGNRKISLYSLNNDLLHNKR